MLHVIIRFFSHLSSGNFSLLGNRSAGKGAEELVSELKVCAKVYRVVHVVEVVVWMFG